jgi:hypothetical protein
MAFEQAVRAISKASTPKTQSVRIIMSKRIRMAIAAASVAAAIGSALFGAASAEATSTDYPSGNFAIVNSANPDLCLGTTGTAKFGLVTEVSCAGSLATAADTWHWTSGTGGEQLVNLNGACLGLNGGKTTAGTQLYGVDGCDGVTRYWVSFLYSSNPVTVYLWNTAAQYEAVPNPRPGNVGTPVELWPLISGQWEYRSVSIVQ